MVASAKPATSDVKPEPAELAPEANPSRQNARSKHGCTLGVIDVPVMAFAPVPGVARSTAFAAWMGDVVTPPISANQAPRAVCAVDHVTVIVSSVTLWLFANVYSQRS